MKRIIILFCCLLLTSVIIAQQQTVSGTVTSDNGALAGVTINEKDALTNGTFTNNSGQFTLQLKGKSRVLIISYAGFITKEVAVGNRTSISVSLATDTKGLDEVVVVGYGRQKKITSTGATSSITGADIQQNPSASLQNTLMGRVPGVITQQRSGRPGSDGADLKIRGLSTPNGTGAPLVVVDDLEYTGSISEIDPDQIESLTVLKDAATTAVFGIKGANGVIVITTRRGRSGRPQITVRSETGLQIPNYVPKYLDAYQVALLRNQALLGDSLPLRYTQLDLDLFKSGADPYGHPNVDWTDILIRKSTLQTRNNLNIQGGSDKAKYFLSAGYLWQNGLLKDFSQGSDLNSNYYYKRYNFRSNLDIQATKTLSLNLDLSGVFAERNEPNIGGRNARNNIFFELSDYNQLPAFAYPIYNPNGTYGINPNYAASNNNIIGRLAQNGYNRPYDNDLTANLKATQKLDFITKGLSIRGVMGYNGHYRFFRSVTRNNFPSYYYNDSAKSYTIFNSNYYRTELPNLGYSSDDGNSFKRLNLQGSITYERAFGKHHVSALALFNSQNDIYGTGVPDAFKGYTARLRYDYNLRYLIEFDGAVNGTSRFPADKRYGKFPAVSAGWNVAEEPFFKKNIRFVDLFKIRGSFGIVGSNEFTTTSGFQYVYLQTYNRTGTYSIGDINQNISGLVEGTLANNITWEKERQLNIGADINLFNGSLRIVADYFRRYRYDILLVRGSVPSLIGVGLPPANLGKVQNNGFEAQVSYNNHIGKFNYNVSGNISVAKNKALYLDEATPAYPYLALTGQPLGSILGYTTLGFYSVEDIANPKVARLASGITRAGDLKYADLNNNGIIDDNDRSVLPYPNLPSTILGFTTGFNYKNFSFLVVAQSALNFALRAQAEAVQPFTNNLREIHTQAWTPSNTANAQFPRLSTTSLISNSLTYPSDFWFRRSDYLRIKTAEIGYSLPKAWVNKVKLAGARIYANGYNLLTWDLKEKNIYDIDPETPSGQDGTNFYPQQKIVNFGIQLTF